MKNFLMKKARKPATLLAMILFSTMTCSGMLNKPMTANAATTDNTSSGANNTATNGNSLFDFEASIKNSSITDGTAPFDDNNDAGNDSSAHNNVCRTFDTITYPLKVTVNPKKNVNLSNIKVQITGKLKNGVTADRVNASFSTANGGTTDIDKRTATMKQEYTVAKTGQAVMLPIVVETKAAENGTVITPKLNVKVTAVTKDGKEITQNVGVVIDTLPSVKISGKVSVGTQLNAISGGDYLKKDVDKRNGNENDLLHNIAMSIYMKPLPGRNNMKGTTAPTKNVRFHFETSGKVSWSDDKDEVLMTVNGKNKPMGIFDYVNVLPTSSRYSGHENTQSEGYTYSNNGHGGQFTAAWSAPVKGADETRTVQNSGKYSVEKPTLTDGKHIIKGSLKDFQIGDTFPAKRGSDGWPIYTAEKKVFSTQGFIFSTPNEYRCGHGMNKQGKANNVYYYVTAVIDSYEDNDGKTHQLNEKFTQTINERNTPKGWTSVNCTFLGKDFQDLGHYHPGWRVVSHGDPTVLQKQQTWFWSCLYDNGFYLENARFSHIGKWNTDSFKMTAEDSKKTLENSWTNNSRFGNKKDQKLTFYWGVAKKTDNSATSIVRNGKDDYTWYDSYEEASKHGEVGALKKDAETSGILNNEDYMQISLQTKTTKIGSHNEKGTPNVGATIGYFQSGDKTYEVQSQGMPKNVTEYDEKGSIIKMQDPVGSTVGFETLGIVSAKTSNSITCDKKTYYATDKINATVTPQMEVPENTSFSDDDKITIKQVLPKGLEYTANSATVGDSKQEPKIRKEGENTMLTWEEYLPKKLAGDLPKIKYQITINPMELEDGMQLAKTIKSITESPLDLRKEDERTSTADINIVKVGMAGVTESINPNYGGRNSDYTLKLQPYTTVDDEANIKMITTLPHNGDDEGSKFSGSTWLKKISLTGADDKKTEFWLNSSYITEKNPNKIDLSKNGWYKYKEGTDLSNVKTIMFRINDTLSKNDKIQIEYQMGTKDNKFNDQYVNKTTLNSGNDYKLSPESQRVRYVITPAVELGFKKIRIYTAKANKGLKPGVIVNKNVIEKDKLNGLSVRAGLYEKNTNKLVASKTYRIADLPDKIEFEIPSSMLTKNSNKVYEARLEGYDDNYVALMPNEETINTAGYTASELNLSNSSDSSKDIDYQGVVMTERIIGQDMKVYREHLTVPHVSEIRTKTGYGIELNNFKTSYTNDLNTPATINGCLKLPNALVEKSLGLTGNDGSKFLKLNQKDGKNAGNGTTQKFSYELPDTLVEQGNGKVHLADEKDLNKVTVDGGKKLYIPIWLDKLGTYNAFFENSEPVGVNCVTFSLAQPINVYAYMYATMGSATGKKDELLLEPVYPDSGRPKGWTQSEIEWLEK